MGDYVAPFPWFGGKRRVAPVVWRLFGDVVNYVEPFFGSGAVLLGRPGGASGIETVNDLDGYVANFWRAVQQHPEDVAQWADWPVNENDLHARHIWLRARRETLQAELEGDPEYCDAKIAGWWVWGLACWIGSGFCGPSGSGPWGVINGQLVHLGNAGQGVARQRVHLGDAGQGVARQLVHLGDAGQGVARQLVHLGDAGRGVARQLVHLGDAGRGDPGTGECGLYAWMEALSERLRRVRVCSGDWARVCGPTPTVKRGLTGVFLDPPYSAEAGRDGNLYNREDLTVAHDVRRWAVEQGDDPRMRIVLCGYAGEHDLPASWTAIPWKAQGGYGGQGTGTAGRENAAREVLWASPHCLPLEPVGGQSVLAFGEEGDDE
jgi:hypothetical protein